MRPREPGDGAPTSPTAERWERISAEARRLLDLGAASRAEHLEELRRRDPELHEEVVSLIAEMQQPGPLDVPVGNARRLVREARLPNRIEAYHLEHEIASGGSSVVFSARSETGPVAVKVLKAGLDVDRWRSRFAREKRLLSRLDHPNVARFIDGDVTPEGWPYLVMEKVDGEPIVSFCRRRSLALEESLSLFLEACAGVAHAHEHLVVHRDLKPDHVLVDAAGVPKILDFGTAKEPPSARSVGSPTTQFFTPEYASPEQMRGERVTPATDVYGLGLILYEMLCGARPLDVSGCGIAEASRIICEVEPEPPGKRQRSARHAHVDIPADLDHIVAKCLRKKPPQRYRSVHDLTQDVRRFLVGRPVHARRGTRLVRAASFWRRNRLLVTSLGIAIAGLAIGLVLAVHGLIEARTAERTAARQRDVALRALSRAQDTEAYLWSLFGRRNRRSMGPRTPLSEVLNDARQCAEEELAGRPITERVVRMTLAHAYASAGLLADAEKETRLCVGLAKDSEDAPSPFLVQAYQALAVVLESRGRLGEAEAAARQALSTHAALPSPRPRLVIPVRVALGAILNRLKKPQEAIAVLENALILMRTPESATGPERMRCLNNLGLAYRDSGQPKRSLACWAEALSLRRGDTNEGSRATILSNRASVLTRARRYDEAIADLEEARDIRESLFGPEDLEVANADNNLALVYRKAGDHVAARSHLRRAYEVYRKKLGKDHDLSRRTRRALTAGSGRGTDR